MATRRPAAVLTITEVAAILDVGRQTVWAAIRRHQRGAPGLPAVRRRQRGHPRPLWLIRPDDVADYIRRTGLRAKPGPRRRQEGDDAE